MSSASLRRVANPPPKPLLLFDGDCHFCRRWIERWRQMTGDAVDYATSQEQGANFPEIPPEEFANAVQLVETDGRVYRAAEAVFRSLGYARGGRWLRWCYERVPGFAAVTETGYRAVAKNRMLASAGTRLLWGHDVRLPTYSLTRRIFLQALGLVFLCAFLSLWVQVDGLFGSRGILPVSEFLPAVAAHLGDGAAYQLPTLFWWNSSDAFLHVVCGAGTLASLLLLAGLLPLPAIAVAFVSYLSLTIAGQTFFSFQWDILLLETAFLALFFAPARWWLWGRSGAARVSRVGLFLLKLLLFKLMFMSGVVKLTSGDDSWWELTALNYHYETQPLPTVLGWWAHQAPEWFGKFSTAVLHFVEMVVPFFIWMPRRVRLLGAGLLIGLQVLIALTGNYAFFNLLTIALCLLLIDDATWRKLTRRRTRVQPAGLLRLSLVSRVQRWLAVAFLVLTLPINSSLIYSAFQPAAEPPRIVARLQGWVAPFRMVSGYGLFRVMTRTRPEIVFEGSADGIDWLPYEFRWKPGPLDRAPRWVAPHQPRVDWQMWFAALGSYQYNPWFLRLSERLLQGEPETLALLEHNPFAEAPPRYLRAILYNYEFTDRDEREKSGRWWKRRELREYVPTMALPER
ncbi:lipase maturation factor family protein [soil metagenome]